MSISSRLARLERIRRAEQLKASPAQRLRAAQEASDAGTATAEQYALSLADDVSRVRGWIMAAVPALLARELAGLWPYGPYRVVIYHPDAEVPEKLQEALDVVAWLAETPADIAAAAALGASPEARLRAAVMDRGMASVAMIVLGDRRGLPLRRDVWEPSDGRWRLTAEVVRASEENGLSPRQADQLLGLTDAVERGVRDGTITTGPWGVSYAEIAAAIARVGWRGRFPPLPWSDLVRSGQPADDPPVCNDHGIGVQSDQLRPRTAL